METLYLGTLPSPEQQRLFQEFLDWRRKQGK